MAKAKTLGLIHDIRKDIDFAEIKSPNALPKLANGTGSPERSTAFESQRGESEGQVEIHEVMATDEAFNQLAGFGVNNKAFREEA